MTDKTSVEKKCFVQSTLGTSSFGRVQARYTTEYLLAYEYKYSTLKIFRCALYLENRI